MTSRLPLALTLSACLAASLSAQSVLHVNLKAPANGNGQSWAAAFQRVEDAADAAKSNTAVKEIWVAFGDYKLSKTIDLRAGLDLLGGFRGVETQRQQRTLPPDLTVLDAGGQFRAITMASSATLADEVVGFTIRGGMNKGSGGGLYCYGGSPTLQELVFEGNQVVASSQFSGSNGGGAYFYQGNPKLVDVIFRNNVAQGSGAGLYAYSGSPALEDCYFIENETKPVGQFVTGRGAGFYCYEGNPTLDGCLFRKNVSDGDGGAFYGYKGAPSFVDCIFEHNQGDSYSATTDYEGKPVYELCVFRGNRTAKSGGGVTRTYKGTLTMRGCVVAGNDGDGVQLSSAGALAMVNVTFAGNGGVGARVAGSATTATFANCLVWGNPGGAISGNATVTYSCVEGGYAGTGNISSDPLLLNAASGNARLGPGSPCFNKGSNAAIGALALDFDGDPRVFGGTVDIGADEYLPGQVQHYANRGSLSVATGGTIQWSVDAGSGNANDVFVLIPSFSGSRPHWQLGSLRVPVQLDDLSLLFISALPGAFVGVLDGNGSGSSSLPLSPLPKDLAGLVLSTAPVLLDGSGLHSAGNDEHVPFVN